MNLLNRWMNVEKRNGEEDYWKIIQHVFGRQYRKRGTQDILKILAIPFKILG